MAHKVETMAYAGEVPWHGLGVKVSENLTPDEMLVKAGLNWSVDKTNLFYSHPPSLSRLVPGKKGLVRSSDGAYLDTVGEDWNPLQNSEAFSFFNDFIKHGDMEMHTAGSLENGRRVWALAKVKDAFELFKSDRVDQYLLFSNPHKYGLPIDIRMTPVRVVCNNTMSFALNTVSDVMVRVHHRTTFDPNIVMNTLGVAKTMLDKYKEAAELLASRRFNKNNVVDFFSTVFPQTSINANKNKETKDDISRNATHAHALEVMNTQPGAEFGKGTWWQAFNTVTYMTDHILGRSQDTRLTSAWFGANRNRKAMALKTAIDFAQAA